MGLRLYTGNIQLIIKDLHVQYRAKQRLFTRRAAAVANDLFGVITLMATHFFHLPGKTRRQFRQRFRRINAHP